MDEKAISEQEHLLAVVDGKFAELTAIHGEVEDAKKEAANNLEAAKSNANAGAHVLFNKETVENLQQVTASLAESQAKSAEISARLLEYQKKTNEVLKYLLSLGVANLANNRAIVSYLKQKLSEGEAKQFDETEQEEILSVIQQLQAQQDLWAKIDALKEKNKEQAEEIASLAKENEETKAELQEVKASMAEKEEGRAKENNRSKALPWTALALSSLGLILGAISLVFALC